MITTRERLRPSEVLALWSGRTPSLDALVRQVVPAEGRHLAFMSQGKAVFEQIVVSAGLAGARVIVPAFFPDDFVGVFAKYRMTPVFVDVEPGTYHLDLQTVTPEALRGARALLLEHVFGLPADGLRYRRFCDEHGLLLIEDCARALGASFRGRQVGSFGQYAMFSLPKCTSVRAGGLGLSDVPLQAPPHPARLRLAGALHAATLVKYPGTDLVEGLVYRLLADSAIYPLEVGNYAPEPVRELDGLARGMLRAFLPHYGEAVARKRAWADTLRTALTPEGFAFQSDGQGDHIGTSIAATPPAGCDSDALKAHLISRGVKASAMWRNAWGVAEFGIRDWGARPSSTPVSSDLARRLVQLPVSRFRTATQSARIIDECRRFVADPPARSAKRAVAQEQP